MTNTSRPSEAASESAAGRSEAVSIDYVAPTGERPLGERFESLAPHHQGTAHREFLEMAQVGTDMIQEVAAAPDGVAVRRDGCYYGDHTETVAFICG